MRLRLVAAVVGCLGLLAACNGDSSDDPEPTNTPEATPSSPAATPTRQGQTPVVSPGTATATSTVTATPTEDGPGQTPIPTPTTETPTQPVATATPTTAVATPTQAPPPPTPTPQTSNNPMSATIGAGASANVWVPANVTIAPGGTVTWSWSGNLPHNVKGDNFALGPTDFKAADTVSFTFTSPGSYTFECQAHPGMRGKVVVE